MITPRVISSGSSVPVAPRLPMGISSNTAATNSFLGAPVVAASTSSQMQLLPTAQNSFSRPQLQGVGSYAPASHVPMMTRSQPVLPSEASKGATQVPVQPQPRIQP